VERTPEELDRPKRDYILSLLQRRDPKLFMEGGCHIFARALRRIFGYSVYGIKKENRKLSHVYCVGQNGAVDLRGKRPEDDILSHYQPYESDLSRDRLLRTRMKLDVDRLTSADYESYGLLSEPSFEASALAFADQHIAKQTNRNMRMAKVSSTGSKKETKSSPFGEVFQSALGAFLELS